MNTKMDWPITEGWSCHICHSTELEWGIVHGICYCVKCGCEYKMAQYEPYVRFKTPVNNLRDEYVRPAMYLWDKCGKPLGEYSRDEWARALALFESR